MRNEAALAPSRAGMTAGIIENEAALAPSRADMTAEIIENASALPPQGMVFSDDVHPKESLESAILESVDVIPISSSGIMEKLYERGFEITIPELMNRLFELINMGKLTQKGVYYLKREF